MDKNLGGRYVINPDTGKRERVEHTACRLVTRLPESDTPSQPRRVRQNRKEK